MIKPGHNLRLPARRLTGSTRTGDSGNPIAETEPYSWKGRVVGKAADEATLPVLWTPDTVAGYLGQTIEEYAATLYFYVANVYRRHRGPVRPPRMILYSSSALAYQAAMALSAELTARHVSAMIHPSNLAAVTQNILTMIAAPTDEYLTPDQPGYYLPVADESQWVGGELLIVSEVNMGIGLNVFSIYDPNTPLITTFPDVAAKSRDLWTRFRDRFDRVRGVAIFFTPVESVVGIDPNTDPAAAYNRASYNAALAGLPDVQVIDLGTLDALDNSPANVEAGLNVPIRAAYTTAIKDFFSIP